MKSYEELLEHLKIRGVIKSDALMNAFLRTDRADFVLSDCRGECYEDYPLPIPCGQTISQPFTVAFMLSLLDVKPGQSVLDIGSGSGWTTALLAFQTGEKGSVTGLERQERLVGFGRDNLSKYPLPQAEILRAGNELGLPGQSFDRILVSAAAPSFPAELLNQLNPGGILVIPVYHAVWKVIKGKINFRKEIYEGFSFVPLVY